MIKKYIRKIIFYFKRIVKKIVIETIEDEYNVCEECGGLFKHYCKSVRYCRPRSYHEDKIIYYCKNHYPKYDKVEETCNSNGETQLIYYTYAEDIEVDKNGKIITKRKP